MRKNVRALCALIVCTMLTLSFSACADNGAAKTADHEEGEETPAVLRL